MLVFSALTLLGWAVSLETFRGIIVDKPKK